MSEFKVGDKVRVIKENEIQDAIGYIFKIEGDKIWLNICGYYTYCYEDEIEFVSMSLDRKIEQLEQRIEKLEKCVMGEQNTIEKRENEPIYERNERFAKILKKELERNEIILNEPKPSLLTEDEREVLKACLLLDYKWITRDGTKDYQNYNGLFVFNNKPDKKFGNYWNAIGEFVSLEKFDHLFQFIKWEDDEPYNIEELLKGEMENEKGI